MRTACLAVAVLISGCSTLSPREAPPAKPDASAATPAAAHRPGAYYKDDGPGANPPTDLAAIPDAVPRAEPLHRYANRPYQALGRDYAPLASAAGFRQRGIASWYGRRYHGQKTSSGEVYDMYAMTGAHPVLPIPSYVRVTNPANGKSVVVRLNDRGPFHADRIIDLSYVAAWKLGFVEAGSAPVEVESLAPGAPVQASPAAVAVSPPPAAGSSVFLQLGAFSARESAEALRTRLAAELAWLAAGLQVLDGGGLYRLQLGPYRSREEARPVAERIQAQLRLEPLYVLR